MLEVSTLESLRLEHIQELLRSSGPCITILLPPYRRGAQEKPTATVLKSDIQEVNRQLAELKLPDPDIADLLAPIHELSKNPELAAGSHWGRAIFRAAGVFRQFQLAEPVEAKSTVAGCFQIRSILTEAQLPAEFYLLKLSKKRVGLLRCAGYRMEPVALPKGVPETFEDALALDQPDHDLENRSAAGSGGAAMRRVRFGTGSGRETQQSYLAQFYKAVDRGIHELLNGRGAGLVLVGVDEDTALYRGGSTYPMLLDKRIHGSPDSFLDEAHLRRSLRNAKSRSRPIDCQRILRRFSRLRLKAASAGSTSMTACTLSTDSRRQGIGLGARRTWRIWLLHKRFFMAGRLLRSLPV